MQALQFDMFEDNTEMGALRRELEAVHSELSNVRRGLFARHGQLAGLYLELKKELEDIKRRKV
jgi:hypothetical protein